MLLLSGWRRRKQTGVVRLQALRCKDPREVLSWLLDSRLHCIPHHFVRSPQPCWDNCFYSSLMSVWPEAALPWKTKAWRANEWKGPAGHFSWVGHYQQALLSYAVKSFALGQSLCSPGFYAGLPSSLKVFGLWNSTTRRNKEKLWKFICNDKENAYMLPTRQR